MAPGGTLTFPLPSSIRLDCFSIHGSVLADKCVLCGLHGSKNSEFNPGSAGEAKNVNFVLGDGFYVLEVLQNGEGAETAFFGFLPSKEWSWTVKVGTY